VDFRDPWIGLTYKRPPTPLHAWRQRRLRHKVLANADLVLATTQASAERTSRVAPPGTKITVLPNGWDPDFSAELPNPRPETGRKLRLVYTGTLWDVPATRVFLTALSRALASQGSRGVEVDLVGPHESAEKRLAGSLGLGDVVRFSGQVGYEESRRRQADADVLLLLQVHGPGYDAAIPGKLYEYLASSRPILALLPHGEAADLVARAGGWVVDPGDERATELAIVKLLRGERPAGDSSSRQMLAYEHRRDRIAERLAHLLDETMRARGAR
jgi:glycosyltransferase involved in cell wall biosynthesis